MFGSKGYAWLLILAVSVLLPSAAPARQIEIEQVHILADPSLTIPLTLIAREYSKQRHISVTTSFAPLADQTRRIEQGMEADIFIATRANTIQTLKNQGLIDVYSQISVTKNRLALVTYQENSLELILIPRLPLASILKRIDPGFSFILGDPETQDVGLFSMEALRNHQIAGELEPHFLFIQSPVDMHETIASRGGYGVIYLTEALRNPELKILGVFPQTAHSSIIYQANVVASENMEAARQFLDYLQSGDATAVFTQFGFEPIHGIRVESGHLARGSSASVSTNPL